MVIDREKVIRGLECIAQRPNDVSCGACAYFRPFTDDPDSRWCDKVVIADDAIALILEQSTLAAHYRDEFMRSWRLIKFSAVETANNNAGPDGNEDVYRILTWVATMMDNQEKGWNDA